MEISSPGLAGTVFACPVCGEPLPQAGRVFRCDNGHAFDVAREGYANLLLSQHRHSKDPGYSKEMIAARRGFFNAGHYQPLADGVADVIISYLPASAGRVVLDAGCGEGYYLRRLQARLAESDREAGTVRCGLDISKHAIRVAARRDQRGLYAVAGTYRMPVLPDRVDVLLTHFSPVSAEDFRRVVRPGGVVVVGGPGEDHLFSLKELVYDTPTPFTPADAFAGEPGFEPIAAHRIRYPLALRGPGRGRQPARDDAFLLVGQPGDPGPARADGCPRHRRRCRRAGVPPHALQPRLEADGRVTRVLVDGRVAGHDGIGRHKPAA